MAVTQYIGARYVPLFFENPNDGTNDWLSGVIYDPLTVVTYLNQSYTSKIPVPASVGDPASNPTYWALTGAYNAQVAQNTSDIAQLQTDVQYIAKHASMTFNSGGGIGNNYFSRLVRIGDEVFVMAQFSLTSHQNSGTLIYTLPAGWIPSAAEQLAVVMIKTADKTGNVTQLNIATDGKITLGSGQDAGEFNIMAMYRM